MLFVCLIFLCALDMGLPAQVLLRSRVAFAPAITADPGAGSGFSITESEFDNQAGVECPYPPCRPLRKDLVHRLVHHWKMQRVHEEEAKPNSVFIPPDAKEYPPPLNLVSGGKDCTVCNDVLLGENINPKSLAAMRVEFAQWRPKALKLKKAREFDKAYAAHFSTVETCFRAFSASQCLVQDPENIETLE